MNAFTQRSFHDRAEAGRLLGQKLKGRPLRQPLVLGIPRGGVVTAAALARELNAELDVVLSRKLRAPYQPEYAIGAISEDGHVTLNPEAEDMPEVTPEYLDQEKTYQLAEIARRKRLFRSVRPAATSTHRSVIITDDGIATGSTIRAALQTVRAQKPQELILAVPVAAPERLDQLRPLCDEVICLLAPENFYAVGQFYQEFEPVEDAEVVQLLQDEAQKHLPAAERKR
jgi:predicted phosphoribosyltransferase